ncbi:hypothetical protein GGR52DRAFT_567686 [Hypoxylon sp. FL1284]|nr:hypothetical protein GGR52DRAFT_567686 [Hypoxylon sp. FL1284]
MARHDRGKARLPKRVELDLTAVVSVDQKFQLQRLVNAILDDMHKHVRDVYDDLSPTQIAPDQGINPPQPTCFTVPNPHSDKYRGMFINADQQKTTGPDTGKKDVHSSAGPKAQKENVKPGPQAGKAWDSKNNKENVKSSYGPNGTAGAEKAEKLVWNAPKSPEEARLMYQRSVKQVLVNSIIELKHDSLAHFTKWRTNVARRMQDIAVKNGEAGGSMGGQELQQQMPGNARRPGDAARGRPILPTAGRGLNGPPTPSETPFVSFGQVYSQIATPLKEGPKEKRALIMHTMLLILLGLDQYSAYSRALLVRLAFSLNVPLHVLQNDETRVSQALSKIIRGIPAEEIVQRRAEELKNRRWKPGMASAALAEKPGSLSPPLAAAGLGTVFGGIGMSPIAASRLLASMNDSTVVVGSLFGLYGARQGAKTIGMYGRDVPGFGMMPLRELSDSQIIDPKEVPAEYRRMRVTVGLAGLMSSSDDLTESWRFLGSHSETYALRWDQDALIKMNTSLELLVKSPTWNTAKKELGSRTVYDRLTRAEWPIGLLKASKIVEAPWCSGVLRADKAGAVLADMLINKAFGERPVSLIGYGLGARIIYHCLMTLSEKRTFGVVDNVVMMGTPCPSEVRVWAALRTVVGGRLINVYSKQDYLLGFLSRNICWHYGVAGLQRVEGVPHVENYDATEVVDNHLRYRHLVGTVLKKVGWEDVLAAEVTAEQTKLAAYTKKLNRESEEQ